MYNTSKLPRDTEITLRVLCDMYPMNKELIDDALEEALDSQYRDIMREDIGLYRGYAHSPLCTMMGEITYKLAKHRTKCMLCKRFELPTE
jgi:hypothetical protein